LATGFSLGSGCRESESCNHQSRKNIKHKRTRRKRRNRRNRRNRRARRTRRTSKNKKNSENSKAMSLETVRATYRSLLRNGSRDE